MRPQSSLVKRLTLMFMFAVTAVLVVAGVAFYGLSQHHFRMLDEQALAEKLESTRHVLSISAARGELDDQEQQLRALLGAHQDLSAKITKADGTVLFSDSKASQIPQRFEQARQGAVWEWQDEAQNFRGITAQLTIAGEPEPVTAVLMLDVTTHAHFFVTLQWWFGIGLVISAIVSAGLGWVVAKSGLRPVRQITKVATGMSAKSLRERIPLEPVPLELQELILSFNGMLGRLEDTFVRLSNFSADIAHELRTPVSNLLTHTEVVLTKKRDLDAYEENLYSNLEDLKRMSRMIDDMLFLAKADNGLIVPEQIDVDLSELVSKLFEYYQFLAEDRGIQLTLQGRGKVRGDRLMIDRALSNLLSNALRYTPEGNEIAVQIEQTRETVTLSVRNSGVTIDPQHIGKIFDRFYRADPARREGGPSNAGLGLSITRSIIETHSGRIWCTSEEGVTTFFISLPASKRLVGAAPTP
ncbi:heavy metal sensor histidine kinase [Pseudomonas fragi]|jgi:two-component system heavy metal sensor histidine kinase CusS|uniref:Sensor protein n=1 Tax=Pseudomonas helleri TaxID=1608996 RepID=A0A7X2CHH6_9PSED|nr:MULTISPECIES: heavy metal sensor histidine kinase [Pseudomonas]AOA07529.1 two-component sensor histidine kinase [Pseudomonas sp. TMW 2.1634]MBM1199761.1 heavy metal sensor histidine kinase [Pseudomonas fragi]MBM1204970.1 heavy metal sensor histidine kinase [Pseudomonas fragi]MQT96414.1 heavy metal sensor histidine kinase [Pseudomonas helleri]MQU31685.1 heavy metal sensor histidine kinase [Pseudomonas helleri]